MPSLIDQMNILKNLPDGALAGELSQPTGAVPPYLVLSEVNRRKDMRQRFEGQMALKKPQTTVVQDQLAGLAPPNPSIGGMGAAAGQGAPMASPGGVGSSPMMPGAPMPASPPSGIAAVPTGYRNGGVVHYANGGSVYADGTDQAAIDRARLADMYGAPAGIAAAPTMDFGANAPAFDTSSVGNPNADTSGTVALPPVGQDYSGINAQYEKQLADANAAKARDPWLGLMMAGLSIAGGSSPYALTNIGTGGAQGLDTYTALMKIDNANATAATEGLMGVKQQMTKEQVATIDQANEAAKIAAANDPNSPQNQSQLVKNINAWERMPEGPEKDLLAASLPPAAMQALNAKKDMAHNMGEQLVNGLIDPSLSGMYSTKPLILNDIAINHPGFNVAERQQDWAAAQANVKSLQAAPQLRLRQALGELQGTDGQPGMLDKLKAVADDWNGSVAVPLNGANLAIARNGGYGQVGIDKAKLFDAQLAETTPTMAAVFSNGNASTDKALDNAMSIFAQDTSKETFDSLVDLVRFNMGARIHALNQAPGGGANNPYNFNKGATSGTVAPPAGGAPNTKVVNGVTYTQGD